MIGLYLLLILCLLFPGTQLHSQQPVINEIMASNATIIADEDGDFSDWIELFNASNDTTRLLGYGLSDDDSLPLKWIFPDIRLAPQELILVFASNKNRGTTAYWKTIIDRGEIWRYRIGDSEPPPNWNTIGFDDSNWLSGASGFGYGDNDDATIISPTISIYLRKTFTANLTEISQALLHVDYDDAFVAYLNGVEIARANIGTIGDRPTFNQSATTYREAMIYQGGYPECYKLNDIQSWMRQGTNVLAIQVHNYGTTSSDLTIIPFFTLGLKHSVSGMSHGVPGLLKPSLPHLHTNFKLKSGGECLILCDHSGNILDRLEFKFLPQDISYGRQPDGGSQWYLFLQPTPGQSNITSGYIQFADAPQFSAPGGFYQHSVSLELFTTSSKNRIYFTLNGEEPDEKSSPYLTPIPITKTTVVRARAYATGLAPSPIMTHSYFINEKITLPVVSLTTDPAHLWDEETGIYVRGKNAAPDFPYFGANFWQEWERPVHIEFFENDGKQGFSLDAGIQIFGGWSRGFAQKSFSIFARSQYGAGKIDYQIFPDKPIQNFESIVLRNSGNDWTSTLFRDAMMQRLIQDADVDIQAYRPAIVFLNGEYWGIYEIREKMNEHFIASNRGVDPDYIDFLENNLIVRKGDTVHYQKMLNYITTHDLSVPSHYDSVCQMMDVNNFIDYNVAEIYYDNTDWPGNNLKYWRPRTREGKWKWMLFDTDFGFGLYNPYNYRNNTLAFATQENGPDWPNPPWSTFLLRNLLKSNIFRNDFINRFSDHLNTTFVATRVNSIIDEMKTAIEPEIPRHQKKWPESAPNWKNNIQVLKNFANNRVAHVRSHILSKFALPGMANVVLDNPDPERGKLRLNSILIDQFPWKGFYFKQVPIKVAAIPNTGFRFVGWSDSSYSDCANLTINLSTDISLTVFFTKISSGVDRIIINEINYHSSGDFNPGDWVEFYNPTDSTVNLTGCTFKDDDDSHGYIFPDRIMLEPYQFLVLCQDTMAFSILFPHITNKTGNFNFSLNAAGEAIRLYDHSGNLVDSLSYDDEPPWPLEPDGHGFTLELKDPLLDNGIAKNWSASKILGGTPGTTNSILAQASEKQQRVNDYFLAQNYPNPFNSETIIRYSLPEDSYVYITVLNMRGQLIRELVNRHQTAGQHQISWNALMDEKCLTRASGVYFYKMTAFSNNHQFTDIKKMLYIK